MKKNNRISSGSLITLGMLLISSGFQSPEATNDIIARAQAKIENNKQYILLVWTANPKINAFNIYSTHDTIQGYSNIPINSTPIMPYNDCSRIEATLRRGSEDWMTVKNTLFSPELNFNPCSLGSIQGEDRERLSALAQTHWRIALVAGLGIIDSTTNVSEKVFYRVCSADINGNSIAVLKDNIRVFYGVVQSPDKVTAKAGDSKVLISWRLTEGASYYAVYRSLSSVIRVQRISENPIVPSYAPSKTSISLKRPTGPELSFLDYQRWDSLGFPIPHSIHETLINGPKNGVTYDYSVKAFDLWGRESAPNTFCQSTPLDKTPPLSPTHTDVIAKGISDSLEIRWVTVAKDTLGHIEDPSISGYYIYRYSEAPESNLMDGVRVGELVANDIEKTSISGFDFSPDLRPEFGEKTFWYRVAAVDNAGNISMQSSPASGHLKDKMAPKSPTGVQTKGFIDSIKVSWSLNVEEDMSGYNVYRSYCHLGAWIECDTNIQIPGSIDPLTHLKDYLPCSGPFGLIGTISQDSAKKLLEFNSGKPFLIDRTVPTGSPICYAYLVKAFDLTGNLSGQFPIPDILTEEIVCQHLLDGTPPDPAIISALLSRDSTIILNWVGAPNQDIVGYHIYRSDNEYGPYKWVGGKFVSPLIPDEDRIMTQPYQAPIGLDVGCQDIPLEPWPEASIGTFEDDVNEKRIYWYKVVGIDYSANESPLQNAVPVSTFTFSTAHPTPNWEITIVPIEAPCGLKISWLPDFNPRSISGFAVYRSTLKSEGPYFQLGSILKSNSFVDTNVIANKKYYYRILLYDTESRMSKLSDYKEGIVIR
jgi:hypothetical protein